MSSYVYRSFYKNQNHVCFPSHKIQALLIVLSLVVIANYVLHVYPVNMFHRGLAPADLGETNKEITEPPERKASSTFPSRNRTESNVASKKATPQEKSVVRNEQNGKTKPSESQYNVSFQNKTRIHGLPEEEKEKTSHPDRSRHYEDQQTTRTPGVPEKQREEVPHLENSNHSGNQQKTQTPGVPEKRREPASHSDQSNHSGNQQKTQTPGVPVKQSEEVPHLEKSNHSGDKQTPKLPPHGLANGTPPVGFYNDSFSFPINWPEKCGPGRGLDLDLIIVVPSAVKNVQHRMAIRNTWAGYLRRRKTSQVIFLLGQTTDPQAQRNITIENRLWMDIVQANFLDTYMNLTLKTVAIMKWVTEHCNQAKFLFKVDDDVLVNPDSLTDYVKHHLQDRKTIAGVVVSNFRPVRNNGKWYVPVEKYPYEFYPQYAFGSCYLLTRDAVPLLYRTSLRLPFFDYEDVFMTGMVAEVAGIRRIYNDQMAIGRTVPLEKCDLIRTIASSSRSPSDITQGWSQMRRTDVKCP